MILSTLSGLVKTRSVLRFEMPSRQAFRKLHVEFKKRRINLRTSRPDGGFLTAMKRKLNEEDVPTAVETTEPMGVASTQNTSFGVLGLESRLLQAVAKENFSIPTQVQAKAIPLALEGKDILARSKTGSGKTAAYVLPILQSILQKKTVRRQASIRLLYRS